MCSMLGRYAEIGLMWATQTQIVERLSRCGGLVVFGWNPTRTLLALLRPDSGNCGARERPNLFLPFPLSLFCILFFFSPQFLLIFSSFWERSSRRASELLRGPSLWSINGNSYGFHVNRRPLLLWPHREFLFRRIWPSDAPQPPFNEFWITTVFHSMSFESILYLYLYISDLLTHTHTATTQRVCYCSVRVFLFVFAVVYLLSDTTTTYHCSINFRRIGLSLLIFEVYCQNL